MGFFDFVKKSVNSVGQKVGKAVDSVVSVGKKVAGSVGGVAKKV